MATNVLDHTQTSAAPSPILPEGFRDLERFAPWIFATSTQRFLQRPATDMADIRDVYDTLTARLPALLGYLAKVPYDDSMSREDRNLMNLMLWLAEIGPSVEWFDAPNIPDSFDLSRMTFEREI